MTNETSKQYSRLVKDTAKITDRRQIVNTLYVSANSILLGGIALIVQQSGLKSLILLAPAAIIAVAGIALCLDWRSLILNYRELLKLRFTMLESLEERADFPSPIQVYHMERKELYDHSKHRKHIRYFGFSHVEVNIPVVFIVLYSVTILGSVAVEIPNIASQLQVWGILPR